MKNTHINYVEFKAKNPEEIKEFYSKAFNWNFIDHGPDYIAFSESGLDGGFKKSDSEITNGAVIIIYHENLDAIKNVILNSKGSISKDIFSFPGGRRLLLQIPLEMNLPSDQTNKQINRNFNWQCIIPHFNRMGRSLIVNFYSVTVIRIPETSLFITG